MRILGIDPGSVKTGYGVINVAARRIECVDYGIIKLGSAPLNDRLTAEITGRVSGSIVITPAPGGN